MASFLSNIIGNPFATQIGQAIEKASNVTESFENWALYMEICDMINNSDDGPRDAIKAFKKLIATNEGKNDLALNQTLTVLETCVKNCGHRFHVLVAQRDFLQEIIKLLTTKVLPSQVTVDRILGLLQTWADAFQGVNGLEEVSKVNKELKEKGFEFPIVDVEHAPPIHTPARKTSIPVEHPSLTKPHIPSASVTSATSQLPPLPDDVGVTQGFYIPASQMAKLKSELDVVIQNCKVFNEMLNENIPGQESEEDWKLMNDLNVTSKECHKRLVELVRKYTIEHLNSDILPVNDEVTNVMLRFERYERLRKGVVNPDGATDELVCISPESGAIQVGNVVSSSSLSSSKKDDDDDGGLLKSPKKIAVASSGDQQNVFNPFAEPPLSSSPYKQHNPKEVEMSKVVDPNHFHKSAHPISNAYTNQELLDVAEGGTNQNNPMNPSLQTTASSQEFDKFLASRTSENLSINQLPIEVTTNEIDRGREKEEELFGL